MNLIYFKHLIDDPGSNGLILDKFFKSIHQADNLIILLWPLWYPVNLRKIRNSHNQVNDNEFSATREIKVHLEESQVWGIEIFPQQTAKMES